MKLPFITVADFEKAVEAVRSGSTVGAASRLFGIPANTLRDTVTGRYKKNVPGPAKKVKKCEDDDEYFGGEVSRHSTTVRAVKPVTSFYPVNKPFVEPLNLKETVVKHERLCRLCLDSENYGECFEKIFERKEIASQIFALTGVQVTTIK